MSVLDYDLVVLGGGNAVTLAIAAGKKGLRVALIEESDLGGVCPNRGCIPSKLLIGYAQAAQAVREAGRFHIEATLGAIDGRALLAETFAATRQTDGKIAGALPDGVTLYRDRGRFVGERTLAVGDVTLRGERVVVATGGRPRRPGGLDGVPYWTSRDVFLMEDLPRSIVVVGGGYIACELAHFFHGVGVETTLVHRGDELLRAEDEEVRAVFKSGFVDRVRTRFGSNVTAVSHDGAEFRVTLTDAAGGTSEVVCEALLYAIGRVPNTDAIGIAEAGIELDSAGYIVVDERLATSAAGVHALGDAIGTYQFTHAAAFQATYLGRQLLEGEDAPIDYGPMPHAVFSQPEVAGVGATEQELRTAGTPYHKAALPYTTAAKGRAIKEAHGLCKLLLSPAGEILGCHIVGEHASALLHEVIPVMKWRNHVSSLTGIIHIHPSLPEVVRNTARRAEALLENRTG